MQLRLSNLTVKEHRLQLVRLKTYLNEDILTPDSLNAYLLERAAQVNPNEFRKTLSSLRRFTRDYLKDTDLFEVVSNYKMPKSPTTWNRSIPDIEQIRVFYNELQPQYQPIFMLYCITGLRARELLDLTLDGIDEDMRCLYPSSHSADSATKHSYFTFYTGEFERIYGSPANYMPFPCYRYVIDEFKRASESTHLKITPQACRQYFSTTLALSGVNSDIINLLTGKTPSSVLAKNYLTFSPTSVKPIYDEVNLTLL
ncbi:MAG: Phage integrase family protein [Candidatus Syntrophoarchaeum sp. GoM_oil]|nr:MAG: Phage integrase family protein [Candidatus Syntrophoarchaeum sp. GoM_oil]